MEWKHVFNTDLNPKKFLGRSMRTVIEAVLPTGYKFFTFNGEVCNLRGEYTGIKVKDLK